MSLQRVSQFFLGIGRRVTVSLLTRHLERTQPRDVAVAGDAGRVLYVPASCLPYHISGYTTRTHAVISALRDTGREVSVLTRPGYPWDRFDRLCPAEGSRTVVDGVEYRHTRRPLNYWPVLAYAFLASRAVEREARARQVSVIHAASNHVNALPALLAARRLGLPFCYEMRGLWELTRISRMPDYEGSQGYLQGLQLEALVARHADRLYVISEQLGRYLSAQWGVDPQRIRLLPNCVDPERIQPAAIQSVEPATVGYAGSLLGYEGLDTLIDAVALLRREGVDVRVDIIGDGEARPALEAQVQALQLQERVHFHGKLSPPEARQRLGRCAVVCIPRKPFRVCELVPPIKLVEAMAMGKPVIVPDLPVFRDELGEQPAGFFFHAGDAQDLARVLGAAVADGEALLALGVRARTYAATRRRWKDFLASAPEVPAGVSSIDELNTTQTESEEWGVVTR